MAGKRWIAGLVAAAVAAGSLAFAAPAAAAPPARATWVQGDSVLAGAKDQVRAGLGGWDAKVEAFVGLGTRHAIQIFRDRQAELGSVVVIELGLNDWGMSTEAYGRLLDEVMAVLAGRHVIWLTSARFRPEMDRVNNAIRAADARHANFDVLEWGPLVDAHPEATYSDRLHLRPAGQRLMADAIRGALEQWWNTSRCEFAEGDQATSNAVARLYRAFFLRAPDQAGMDYWVPKYRSHELCLSEIAEFFAQSQEFVAAYGSLDIPSFVRRVYLNVLGREPDPDGYNHWAVRLTYGGLRRGEMMAFFSDSPEFRARTGLA
jgi:hypothetical protein